MRQFVIVLAAVLLVASAAVAGDPAKPAADPTPGPVAADRAPRVERHSPREGYPSLGPPGARNTLIFFTDYQ